MVRRTSCGACGYDDLELVLDLGASPVADAYTSHPHELVLTHPVQLAVCGGCWLVQLLDVLPADLLFGTGYSFYSSASAPLSAYHAAYADDLLRRHGELAKRGTVEIGCNDGDLLRHFNQAGCPTLGIDPAAGPTDMARGRGLDVRTELFGLEAGSRLRDERGPAGLVVANHVLAHVADPADLLGGIRALLADDGVAYVEVQYLPDLLVNNAFDLVYHEHRNFFSLTSLQRAAQRWGLCVNGAWLTDRQGGSLRVELGRDHYPSVSRDRVLAGEGWLRDRSAYRGLQGRADRVRTRLVDLVERQASFGVVAAYGAPAKLTTLLHWCGLDDQMIRWAYDTTPAKQGRWIPGTGIRITPPPDPSSSLTGVVATLLVAAWNYAGVIMRQHPGFAAQGGRWLLPIPAPVLL